MCTASAAGFPKGGRTRPSSAARARTWTAWRRSGCRCRRGSRSARRCARAYYDEWRGVSPPTRCTRRLPPESRISKQVTGKKFGDAADPLLVSVRSGARVSMPGMMDTVLNLGLNDETVKSASPPRRATNAFRMGQLSPLHPDVCRCRARPRSWRVRGSAGDRQRRPRFQPRYRDDGEGLAETGRRISAPRR